MKKKEYYKLGCQIFMTFFKGSTYSAVVPLTNLFGLYQIPEPEPGQLMIPINLVFPNDV